MAIIFFRSVRNNINFVEGFKILHPVKIRCSLSSSLRGEVENSSANQRRGGHLFCSVLYGDPSYIGAPLR